jgi:hypothetical protein
MDACGTTPFSGDCRSSESNWNQGYEGVMHVGEFFGYSASLLVFAAFYMKSMVPLRVVAIASNIAFMTYAWLDGLTPILVLHGALLPLNLLRLSQLRRLEHGLPNKDLPFGK